MSEPDLFAQDILDAQPDVFDRHRVVKVTRVVRTQAGASLVTVQVDDEELECDWLRSFNSSVTAGVVTPGTFVLVHLVDGQCVIADVIVRGAKSLG